MLLTVSRSDFKHVDRIVVKIDGQFSVQRVPRKRKRRPLSTVQVQSAMEAEEIEFPHGPLDDPLAVQINGETVIFGKVQYRLLRWLYWHWKNDGQKEFDFAVVGEEVWEDDLTERKTIEVAVNKIKASLEFTKSCFHIKHEKERIYVMEK